MSTNFVLTDVRHTKPILSDLKKINMATQEKYISLRDKLNRKFSDTTDGVGLISVLWLNCAIMTCVYQLQTSYFQTMLVRLRTLIDTFADYHTTLLMQMIRPLSMFFPFESFRVLIYYYISTVYKFIYGFLKTVVTIYGGFFNHFYLQMLFVMTVTTPLMMLDLALSFGVMFTHEIYAILFGTKRKRAQFFYRFAMGYGMMVLIMVDSSKDNSRVVEIEDYLVNCLKKMLL
jgi:hypothetical protein